MTTIQLVGVQEIAGRHHKHVRVFGYNVLEPEGKRRIVEVAVSVDDAVSILKTTRETGELPEIEVPDKAWMHCLYSGDIRMVHVADREPSA